MASVGWPRSIVANGDSVSSRCFGKRLRLLTKSSARHQISVRHNTSRPTHTRHQDGARHPGRTRTTNHRAPHNDRHDQRGNRRIRPPPLAAGRPIRPAFTDDATALIHQSGRGKPRAVNRLALAALIAACAAGKNLVDEASARSAVTETSHDTCPSPRHRDHPAQPGASRAGLSHAQTGPHRQRRRHPLDQ